ncbi:MAG: hypothetical protein JWQ54_5861 [Mucilaginibacter sp.]|nr:hypothetical protein [Mucilaginibacter sp.]
MRCVVLIRVDTREISLVKIETVKQQLILEYLSTDISLRKLAYKYGYDHNVKGQEATGS